jgi:ADP-heptose:LPS heptosyltransferase
MGDVALTLLALKIVIQQNPQIHIILVTKEKFAPLFLNQNQIKVIGVDFSNYKGIFGLFRLFALLKKQKIKSIIDLHQNLRTFFLKLFFRFSGTSVLTYSKGRTEKKEIISKKRTEFSIHTIQRYLEPFDRLLEPPTPFVNEKFQIFDFKNESLKKADDLIEKFSGKKLIGIAPFAQHKGKVWPLEKYVQLCKILKNKYPDSQILFFGGGINEKDKTDEFLFEYGENTIGNYLLREELKIISNLSLMICGDSSNMHLAALAGIPVVSIWGATHISTGFGPVFGNEKYIVETPNEDLTCRPCSVYGNIPCHRGDYACLNHISTEMVLTQIQKILI